MARKKSKLLSVDKNAIRYRITQLNPESDDYWSNYYYVEEYVRTSFNKKDLKKECVKWTKDNNANFTKCLTPLEDWKFVTLGKLCFILNNQGKLDEGGMEYLKTQMNELCEDGKRKIRNKKESTKKSTKKLTIQDYLRAKASAVAGEYFDSELDRIMHEIEYTTELDPLKVMYEQDLSQGHARYILSLYESEIVEFEELLSNKADPDLKEAYASYSKKQLSSALSFMNSIKTACGVVIKKASANRKPKKTAKTVDIFKRVEKLKYLKEFAELSLVSESPTKIIGAKEVWVYNTKTRKVGKYVAMDVSGLDISGTTIKNASVDKSIQKTLRKPAKQIKDFMDGGTRKFNNAFKAINGTDIKLKTRVNENVVILKVFK
jgi:hypothetical protein